jgi:signal transduction histidine kinase
MEAGGAAVPVQTLLERVWDENIDPWTNTLRMTVMTLRPQARRPARRGDGQGRRLPALTLRARLTALYGGLFGGAALLLMAASYLLLRGYLRDTLPGNFADDALDELLTQYALAFVGVMLVALALGWAVAGRALAPLRTMTATAREVSQDRLDRRIALAGPRDELRELADTFDAMLDRLQDSFDGQRRFVANASHELRSPLTLIRAEADVALANPDADEAELRAMAEAVRMGTERMERLLEGLLLLARSQRGLARREPLDLAEVCERAAGHVRGEAAAARVELRVATHPAPVTGDAELLVRLVENLLENGVRHNRPGAGWRRERPRGRAGRPCSRSPTPGRGSSPRRCGGSRSRSSGSAGGPTAAARAWA